MPEYNFHIHGKPYSQDIWKNDEYHDYLSGIYSNIYLNACADESFLIIEILNNTVHYTYMRSKDIRDSKGRDDSFFAMTVSIKGHYCSVISLYNLLDQIYNKIAKPSFFNKDGKYLQYKVIQLEDAKVGNAGVVDQIKTAFDKNVTYLDLKNLDNSKDTIRSAETKVFSIMDVDSPEFISELKKYRIVVSSFVDSAIKRCGNAEAEYAAVRDKNILLTTQNNNLNSQITSLNQRIELLLSQLNSSATESENKYKDTINQLKREVGNISMERDLLRRKIDEATSSVELIEKPVQKLTRLLAGRFPEKDKIYNVEDTDSSQESYSKNSNKTRISGLNTILLSTIICLCLVILYFVAFKPNIGNKNTDDSRQTEASDTIIPNYDENKGVESLNSEDSSGDYTRYSDSEDPSNNYDTWESCSINIRGGGNNIRTNRNYTLEVTKRDWHPANVPHGYWRVWTFDPNQPINTDNTFILPGETDKDTNVMIEYIVDGQVVLRRTSKVIK